MAELRSLSGSQQRVNLLAISVDSHEQSLDFKKKIAADGKGPVNYPLLSDPDHRVIDSYGLHDSAYDKQKQDGIPHPAVYVIDRSGRVVWVKVELNYRERPSIGEIRSALEGIE